MMVLFQMPLLPPSPRLAGVRGCLHIEIRGESPSPVSLHAGRGEGLNRALNDYDRGGRTGAENCSVRSRSLMSTTVSIGADSS